jgi:hypothetical protein
MGPAAAARTALLIKRGIARAVVAHMPVRCARRRSHPQKRRRAIRVLVFAVDAARSWAGSPNPPEIFSSSGRATDEHIPRHRCGDATSLPGRNEGDVRYAPPVPREECTLLRSVTLGLRR